ncbi:MAG: hypothetical protein ACKVJK_18515 [Methylophagaceae bacterium]|jgi:hypothetical protein|tara:strand:+ start:509 stop:691 length:183 start_codon:yes stop_codon:yes gene_type:complete
MKSIKINEATPAELKAWAETDYFMSSNFDPLTLFVVIPSLIQFIVFGGMLLSFKVIGSLF